MALAQQRLMKILFVSNDCKSRSELASYLIRHGIESLGVGNSSEAKEMIFEQNLSLVVVDVASPEENGLPLTQ